MKGVWHGVGEGEHDSDPSSMGMVHQPTVLLAFGASFQLGPVVAVPMVPDIRNVGMQWR
jgi:hypothetical protein